MKSNLEKTLEQLSAPYKKSEQYIILVGTDEK